MKIKTYCHSVNQDIGWGGANVKMQFTFLSSFIKSTFISILLKRLCTWGWNGVDALLWVKREGSHLKLNLEKKNSLHFQFFSNDFSVNNPSTISHAVIMKMLDTKIEQILV